MCVTFCKAAGYLVFCACFLAVAQVRAWETDEDRQNEDRQAETDAPEVLWRVIRTRQKQTGQYALVLKTPHLRLASAALARYLQERHPEVRELLGGVAIVCLPRGFVKQTFKKEAPEGNCLLVSPAGKVVAVKEFSWNDHKSAKTLAGALTGFLFGDDHSDPHKLRTAVLKEMTPSVQASVKQALKDLDADDFRTRRRARKTLRGHPAALLLVLHLQATSESIEVRTGAHEVLCRHAKSTGAIVLGAYGEVEEDAWDI